MKSLKKVASILTALAMIVGFWPAVSTTAKADAPLDSSYMESAVKLQLGETVELTLSGDEKAVYCVDVEAGKILNVVKQQPAIVIQLYDPNGEMGFSTGDSSALSIVAKESGSYYLFCYLGNGLGTVSDSITVTVSDNDAFEPNDENSLAKEITSGETAEFLLPCNDYDWFFVETTEPGQLITVKVTSARSVYTTITNVNGSSIASQRGTEYTLSVCGEYSGIYGIRCSSYESGADLNVSLTVTVDDNDGNEMNNDMDSATEVVIGAPVELILGAGDADWFKVTTTEPGQFIQMDISGFSETNQGSVRITIDETTKYNISGKETLHFQAAEAGDHYIKLNSLSYSFASGSDLQVYDAPVKLNMTVTLIDNDSYEPNGDMYSATEATVGESMELILGYSDWDWFKVTATEAGQIIEATLTLDASDGMHLSIFDKDGNSIDTTVSWSGTTFTCWAVVPEADVYYVQCYGYNDGTCAGTLTVALVDNDDHEPNNDIKSAKKITAGESLDILVSRMDDDWFAIDLEAGQFMMVTKSQDNACVQFYGPNQDCLATYNKSGSCSLVANEAGTYYIRCYYRNNEMVSETLTVTLADNDGYECNNTQESAYELVSGQTAEFTLGYSDVDWFVVETTQPGQDIQIDISGFNYANKGSLYLSYDETHEIYVSSNKTYYFHAAEAGSHYIKLYGGSCSTAELLKLSVTATVLDGDEHEGKGNETTESAVTLNLGTDETFNIGGWGDEDWFQFEVAPEEGGSNLYTLQFLDLNPDYSDEFYYEVYAPDGTVVTDTTLVNIHHSNILACDQQGMYKVRIYGQRRYQWGEELDNITRSNLRIRVSMGGNDPYENNDTWLDAKPIQIGQMVQHVLATTSDYDWFYFTAEEADMSYTIDVDSTVTHYIYSVENLVEYGTSAESISSYAHGKLGDAGVYYVEIYTDTSYVSEDLRSFTVTLEPHAGEENNDTWDKATPIYESVPKEFDIVGSNDTDWFVFTVPEGATKVTLQWAKEPGYYLYYCYVYREEDILNVGLNATPVSEEDTFVVTAGTYYVEVRASWFHYTKGCTLTYFLSYNADASSIENALPLEPGVWSEKQSGTNYYSIGTLNAGDLVRYNRDGAGTEYRVSLYDSTGYRVNYSTYANDSFYISTAGEYYLEVYNYYEVNENGELYTNRIRYDVGSGEEYVTEIEGPDIITLKVGETQFVDLRLAPYTAMSGSGKEIYISNNSASSVATYSDYTGYVTAVALGTTNLTFWVYTGNGYVTKAVTVNVVEETAAESVSISGAPEEMELGSGVQLTAILTPDEANETVTWSSSDTSVLYVSNTGKVVAVGEGEATITATVAAGSAEVTIAVIPATPTEDEITSLVLDKYSLTMYVGEETQQLMASVLPEGIEATVQWVSSNTAAATVDQEGVVTAVAPGISIITASAGDYNASCIVTVQAERVRVTGISFAESSLQIPLGGQTVLIATIEPYNATTKTLTWVSDDESVATVSRTGIVNALAVGVTTIRATTLDGGFVAEITIEVTAKAQMGDINGDGYINSADALIALRVVVGLTSLTDEETEAADVNGDGWVDAGDAIKILRYDAKLIDSLE